jgi:hypothetical protein
MRIPKTVPVTIRLFDQHDRIVGWRHLRANIKWEFRHNTQCVVAYAKNPAITIQMQQGPLEIHRGTTTIDFRKIHPWGVLHEFPWTFPHPTIVDGPEGTYSGGITLMQPTTGLAYLQF